MKARGVLLFAVLLAGAGCSSAPGRRGVLDGNATRTIPLGDGIALPAGPMIVALPPDQRYRFVPPDSLVRGATREDVASAQRTSELRASIAIVLQSQGWRESDDSAGYDLTVFVAARTLMRTEEREELIVSSPSSGLPRCDLSRMGNQPRCTNETQRTRMVRVSVPYTVSRVIHVMRRRSDGAARVWSHPDLSPETIRASVARDLLRLLASGGD